MFLPSVPRSRPSPNRHAITSNHIVLSTDRNNNTAALLVVAAARVLVLVRQQAAILTHHRRCWEDMSCSWCTAGCYMSCRIVYDRRVPNGRCTSHRVCSSSLQQLGDRSDSWAEFGPDRSHLRDSGSKVRASSLKVCSPSWQLRSPRAPQLPQSQESSIFSSSLISFSSVAVADYWTIVGGFASAR